MPARQRAAAARMLPVIDVQPVDRQSSAAEVVRHAIAASVDRLVKHDPVIRAGRDPEGVHQARVATRRLRSDLRTFRPMLDADWAEALRERLHGLADRLGEVRDNDVLLQRLRAAVAELEPQDQPGAEAALAVLATSGQAARSALRAELQSGAYTTLLEQLAAAAAAPRVSEAASGSGTEALPPLAAQAWRRLRRKAAALGSDPPDDSLHQLRILAKRARYALEAISPVTRTQVGGFARSIAALQDVLGGHHDAVVAEAWLRAHADVESGDRLAIGQLIAQQRAAAAGARSAWPAAWKRVREKHPDAWV